METYTLLDTFSLDGFYLTQSYGVNADYYKQWNLLFHEGIDFGNKNKSIVFRNPLPRAVVLQDWDTTKDNYGEYVVLWDYVQKIGIWVAHFDDNFVSIGDELKAGDKVGEMGGTGNTNGEHIHLNFVLTDDNGNRLYRTKGQNWGFLDPQHPLDNNPPIKLPGIPEYRVNWVKNLDSPTPPAPTPPPVDHSKCEEELRRSRQETTDARNDRGLMYVDLGVAEKVTDDPGVEKGLEAIKQIRKERDQAKEDLAVSARACQNQIGTLKAATSDFLDDVTKKVNKPIKSYEEVSNVIGLLQDEIVELKTNNYKNVDNTILFFQIIKNVLGVKNAESNN